MREADRTRAVSRGRGAPVAGAFKGRVRSLKRASS